MSEPLYLELYDCQRTMCKITGRELEKESKNYSRTVFSSASNRQVLPLLVFSFNSLLPQRIAVPLLSCPRINNPLLPSAIVVQRSGRSNAALKLTESDHW